MRMLGQLTEVCRLKGGNRPCPFNSLIAAPECGTGGAFFVERIRLRFGQSGDDSGCGRSAIQNLDLQPFHQSGVESHSQRHAVEFLACNVRRGTALRPSVEFGGEAKPSIASPDEPVQGFDWATVKARQRRCSIRHGFGFCEPAIAYAPFVFTRQALPSLNLFR